MRHDDVSCAVTRMAFLRSKGLLFVLIIQITGCLSSFEREITIEIDPGRQECFYQDAKRGNFIEVDYQVISGGQGNLDISFALSDPTGAPLIHDYKEPENSHRVEALIDGDYRMCWDNTFSHFNSKTVFFELTIESPEIDNDPWNFELDEGLPPNKVYEMTVQDIQDSIARVRAHLTKIRHLQDSVRAFEARDRNVAESNFTRVNSWSMIQIFVMMFVGVIQVVLVRSLFDDKSRVHRLWKQKFSS